MKKRMADEGLVFDNLFETISKDSQTAEELMSLANIFIEVRDAIDEQDARTSLNKELLCLFQRALDVFDTPLQAKEWLESRCPALGGCAAVTLLKSVEGRELVTQTLQKIEFGEFP